MSFTFSNRILFSGSFTSQTRKIQINSKFLSYFTSLKPNTILNGNNHQFIEIKSFYSVKSSTKNYLRFTRRAGLAAEIAQFPPKNQSLLINNRNIQISNQIKQSNQKITQQEAEAATQKSIFKRFKDAYKQHGKILIWCHFVTCFGWIVGFFLLAQG
jgi:hypothetical protein